MAENGCPAVILAAGASLRLGQPKQLVTMHGESLVRRAVIAASEAGFTPVYVVLGAYRDEIRRVLSSTPAIVLENPGWPEGMASSLRCGVETASASGAEHLLVMVCDQPGVTVGLLAYILQRHSDSRAPLTAAEYAGRLGVPAIFSSAIFPELLQVTGDQGAREVISRYASRAERVPFAEGTRDIDTPEDLDRL